MKTRLWIIVVLVVITMLPVASRVLAQDSIGNRCVIIQSPSRTELGITGPVVTVGGMHNLQVTGPQVMFSSTEAGGGPTVLLPAVQIPPDPCSS